MKDPQQELDELVVLDKVEILVNSDIRGMPEASGVATGTSVIGAVQVVVGGGSTCTGLHLAATCTGCSSSIHGVQKGVPRGALG